MAGFLLGAFITAVSFIYKVILYDKAFIVGVNLFFALVSYNIWMSRGIP